MSKDSVPIASTSDMVIPTGICRHMTIWALGPVLTHPKTEPVSKAWPELTIQQVEAQRDKGTTLSQSPSWGMADERARALEWTSRALSKRVEKQASSTAQERESENRVTSMCLIELQSDLAAALAKEHIN